MVKPCQSSVQLKEVVERVLSCSPFAYNKVTEMQVQESLAFFFFLHVTLASWKQNQPEMNMYTKIIQLCFGPNGDQMQKTSCTAYSKDALNLTTQEKC